MSPWVSIVHLLFAAAHPNCFRFAYSASSLEDQKPCGKDLCSSSVEALVCFNFGSLASYWPRPWSDFGVPWGPGDPPKGAWRFPRDNPKRPKLRPWSASQVPLGGPGLPRGAGGLKETTQATQNVFPAAEAIKVLEKHPKTPSISLRRNVYAVEARSPYWSKESAGRTRFTTARRKL